MDESVSRTKKTTPSHGVSLRDAFLVWLRIAMLSFGGPAGQIALMHRILVDEKKWISDSRFLHALNYCMLLPGPEALATYIGWLMHRTVGGLIAGGLFIVPGVISLNGTVLYSVTDRTFTAPGKVALWTKADSATRFDQLEITPLP